MDDIIGQGREPSRNSRPPWSRLRSSRLRSSRLGSSGRGRVAGWALVAVAAGMGVIGLGLRHGAGSPGSSAASPAAVPHTWAAARGGVVGATVAGVQAPVMALAVAAGGPGMTCSPSTGACSIRVEASLVAPIASAGSGTTRLGLRAPSLWEGL